MSQETRGTLVGTVPLRGYLLDRYGEPVFSSWEDMVAGRGRVVLGDAVRAVLPAEEGAAHDST